jgi:hypothetical protein
LFNRPNPFIIAGDFNAHHSIWDSNSSENTTGKSIHSSILDHSDAAILNPINIGTRVDPASGREPTIDLIITSSRFSLNSVTTQGPYTGSNHLPIITTLNASPIRLTNKLPSWIFDKSKWPQWNAEFDNLFIASSYLEHQDPAQLYELLKKAILSSGNTTFRKSTQSNN